MPRTSLQWLKKWRSCIFLGMVNNQDKPICKTNMSSGFSVTRNDACKIFQAGIAAADPYKAVKRCLSVRDNQIEIALDLGNKRIGKWSRIHLIAFGKAACAMANAAQETIPKELLAENGVAVTNYENVVSVNNFNVIGANHPIPDSAGLKGAKMVNQIAENAGRDDLVLVLISGGGSALIPNPVQGISLKDKQATTDLLLACGATINQINCVRKHLSQLKGGGLARKVFPAYLHALILSDVLDDDLSTIASGPTVADDTSFQDACSVLESVDIWNKIPGNVRDHMESGKRGVIPETPKKDDKIFAKTASTLIGSNVISLQAIIAKAAELNYATQLYSNNLCGEARDAAEKLALYTKKLMAQGIDEPLALLAGGETTITLKGNGSGGRNQEMALAFALAADKHELPPCWTFLSGGTDGLDGPTDAAGGIVDPNSINRMLTAEINPVEMLENNDSYNALKSSQDLLNTGATGTNVADLQVLLIQPQT